MFFTLQWEIITASLYVLVTLDCIKFPLECLYPVYLWQIFSWRKIIPLMTSLFICLIDTIFPFKISKQFLAFFKFREFAGRQLAPREYIPVKHILLETKCMKNVCYNILSLLKSIHDNAEMWEFVMLRLRFISLTMGSVSCLQLNIAS